MSIEQHAFEKALNLSPENMIDLVETVGAAAILSASLAAVPNEKITIALVMISQANMMLEQCGCKIDTKIYKQSWTHPATYQTDME